MEIYGCSRPHEKEEDKERDNPFPCGLLRPVRVGELQFRVFGHLSEDVAEDNVHKHLGVHRPAIGIQHWAKVTLTQSGPCQKT